MPGASPGDMADNHFGVVGRPDIMFIITAFERKENYQIFLIACDSHRLFCDIKNVSDNYK